MPENTGVLVVGELGEGGLAPITPELLGIGRKLADGLGQALAAVLVGGAVADTAREAIFYGADRVYLVEAEVLADYLTDSYVAALEKLNQQARPEIMLFGHTAMGRDLAPALAFRLGTGVTLDCVGLDLDPATGLLQKTKPVYGGNAVAVYVCQEGRPQMAAVRPRAMAPLGRDTTRHGEVIAFDPGIDPSAVRGRVVRKIREAAVGMKLEEAPVIVCGGRGIGSAEAFKMLEKLAAVLGGTIGATRPPCDARWVPDYCQIGLTGKLVAPDLYIGVALSGASQHVAGMSGSKNILAINKDPQANIFKVAHFGVVGEYQKVLPAFVEKCRELLS
ncbi:MAG: electron transfer flavoprotein subunit alpha/FixB family protein [Chloroflexota bacterium]